MGIQPFHLPFLTCTFQRQPELQIGANWMQCATAPIVGDMQLPQNLPSKQGIPLWVERSLVQPLLFTLLFYLLKVISSYIEFVVPICIQYISFRSDLFIIIIMHFTYILLYRNDIQWHTSGFNSTGSFASCPTTTEMSLY